MQNKTRIAIGLMAVMFALAVWISSQKTSELRFSVKGDTAIVNGGTDSRSYSEMKTFLNNNPDVRHLILRDMPGTTDAMTNLKIARMIRKRGITTHLQRRSRIASGAVDLFISGARRTMECGARIGVHSWSVDGRIGPKRMGADYNQPVHEEFLADMGIDPAFYVFTRDASEPENIYIMKYAEIEEYGLLTEPAGCEL